MSLSVIFERAGGDSPTFTMDESEVLQIEGVRFSAALLKSILNDPPVGAFSFRRDGENIVVTQHPESALPALAETSGQTAMR